MLQGCRYSASCRPLQPPAEVSTKIASFCVKRLYSRDGGNDIRSIRIPFHVSEFPTRNHLPLLRRLGIFSLHGVSLTLYYLRVRVRGDSPLLSHLSTRQPYHHHTTPLIWSSFSSLFPSWMPSTASSLPLMIAIAHTTVPSSTPQPT